MMKMTKSNSVVLLILALIFAAPGISAYLYYRNPQWVAANTTNKGSLLTPPPFVEAIKDEKSRLHLVFWYPDRCETACLQELDRLARIRLALGRRLYEVGAWLVLPASNQPVDQSLTALLQDQAIHLLQLPEPIRANLPLLNAKPRLFIANSKGYLVLTYEAKANSEDIFHDLKQLLRS